MNLHIPADRRQALKIAIMYAVVGSLWILLSGFVAKDFAHDVAGFMNLGLFKDLLFVFVTAGLMYLFVECHFRTNRRVNASLRESEERLNLTMSAINDGVWDWDLRSGLAYLSPKYFEIAGCRPEDIVPNLDFFISLIHPDDREKVMGTINMHLGGATADSIFECRIFTGQDSLKWILGRGKVVKRDSDGQPLRMLGTITDITKRKKIEQALLESEARYRAVVQDQTEIICRFLPDGTLTFVNEVYCRLFGKTHAELVGNRWHPKAHPEDLPLIEERLKEMSPNHSVVVIENRVYTATGEVRWMQFVNRGFYDDNGKLLETQAVGRDITGRKLAEAKIERYADEVHDLYNNAPCGYHSLDANGIYARINDTELKWLGYQREEIIGKMSFADLIPEEDRAAFQTNFARFMEQGSVEGLEYIMVRKDGTRLSVLLNATIVRDEKGRYVMSRGAILDITERKKAEESMRHYARRLIELEEEMRKTLAAELHDEIGRDLTALGLSLAVMHDHLPGELNKKLADRLDDAQVMLESISRTIRGLMSKLRPPVLDDYGLPATLSWHCDLFSKRSGLAVDLLVDGQFPRLSTDRELALFRIAQEALSNVSKHAGACKITVSLLVADKRIRLLISDDGTGFDATRTKNEPEGSHWGLTMMRERAEAVNGTFQLVTSPGSGTTILVELGRNA